jgi:DNA-binding MarR family transcriptional regulator
MTARAPGQESLFAFLRTQALVRRSWGRFRGLGVVEYGVLEAVARFPGSTPSSVAAQLDLPRSAVSACVASLSEAGLLRRVEHGADARRVRLLLTEQGHRIRVQCAARWSAIERQIARLVG